MKAMYCFFFFVVFVLFFLCVFFCLIKKNQRYLTGYTVTVYMVSCYVMTMTITYLLMTEHLFDTIIVV